MEQVAQIGTGLTRIFVIHLIGLGRHDEVVFVQTFYLV
jgi:hypothetical protein